MQLHVVPGQRFPVALDHRFTFFMDGIFQVPRQSQRVQAATAESEQLPPPLAAGRTLLR
jgi:hypothetical protein